MDPNSLQFTNEALEKTQQQDDTRMEQQTGFYESCLDQTSFLYLQPSVRKDLFSAIVEDNAVTKTVC